MAHIPVHIPVLRDEVITALAPTSGDRLLDATLGLGGHTQAYLEAAPGTTVVGFEADPSALAAARQRLAPYASRITYINRNFASLKDSLTGGGILQEFTHVLFDLGIGSHQIAEADRGFSFQSGTELSMRYGDQTGLPDAELASLNRLTQRRQDLPDVPELLQYLAANELAEVLKFYGEERYSRRIARALQAKPLPATAQELADRVAGAVPAPYRHGRLNPATRTFQALRLAVNRELEALAHALPQAVDVLKPRGLIAVINFHSLEDRIVKHFFRDQAATCVCPPELPQCICETVPTLEVLTKKPIRPSLREIENNPRSRSAKLRLARKIDTG